MEGFIIEVKINKEIQRYQESILFGLSLRQMVFALLAIGVAVGAYFGLKPLIGAAEVGWVCMLAAFPFAMCGFFTYNGMPAERFLLAVVRSEILCPRTLSYHPQNLYAELLLDNSTMRESVEFGGLLGSAPIMPVHTASAADFIARGGRIPAPMQSLKN